MRAEIEMQNECSWRILRITIKQKWANKSTNKLWSWKFLQASLSKKKKKTKKTVSHADFSLQYFLRWLKPSDTELPSALLSLECLSEDRYLSTRRYKRNIQPWERYCYSSTAAISSGCLSKCWLLLTFGKGHYLSILSPQLQLL